MNELIWTMEEYKRLDKRLMDMAEKKGRLIGTLNSVLNEYRELGKLTDSTIEWALKEIESE